jgi:hypothetical protein
MKCYVNFWKQNEFNLNYVYAVNLGQGFCNCIYRECINFSCSNLLCRAVVSVTSRQQADFTWSIFAGPSFLAKQRGHRSSNNGFFCFQDSSTLMHKRWAKIYEFAKFWQSFLWISSVSHNENTSHTCLTCRAVARHLVMRRKQTLYSTTQGTPSNFKSQKHIYQTTLLVFLQISNRLYTHMCPKTLAENGYSTHWNV